MHGLAGDGSELSEYGRLVDSVALELTRAPNFSAKTCRDSGWPC